MSRPTLFFTLPTGSFHETYQHVGIEGPTEARIRICIAQRFYRFKYSLSLVTGITWNELYMSSKLGNFPSFSGARVPFGITPLKENRWVTKYQIEMIFRLLQPDACQMTLATWYLIPNICDLVLILVK